MVREIQELWEHRKGNGRSRIRKEIIQVYQAYLENPKKSTRSSARNLNIKHSTLYEILKRVFRILGPTTSKLLNKLYPKTGLNAKPLQ